jgi:hypothetical protein
MLLEVFGLSSGFTAYWLTRNWLDVAKLQRGETLKDGSIIEKEEKPGEAVGLYIRENKFIPPIYLNVGTLLGVGIPVGGGFETDYIPVFHSVRTGTMQKSIKVLDLAGDAQTTYINDVNTLENFLSGHQITLADIPVTFPLQVRKKQLSSHMWYSSKWGIGGSDRRAVATYIAKARRWAPGEFVWASALVATISVWMLSNDLKCYRQIMVYNGSNKGVKDFLMSKVGW